MKFTWFLIICLKEKWTYFFTPYFYWIIAFCFQFPDEQKKNASKNIDFWPSYARSKYGYFSSVEITSGWELSLWHHWGQTVKMGYSKIMTLCKKYCKIATTFCLRKYSKTISEVKRHQLGFGQIWVNSLNF